MHLAVTLDIADDMQVRRKDGRAPVVVCRDLNSVELRLFLILSAKLTLPTPFSFYWFHSNAYPLTIQGKGSRSCVVEMTEIKRTKPPFCGVRLEKYCETIPPQGERT
jgi:hypothetical protein